MFSCKRSKDKTVYMHTSFEKFIVLVKKDLLCNDAYTYSSDVLI